MHKARLARIDEHLRARYIEAGKIPGAVTCVYRQGDVEHLSVLGQRDRERGTAMTDDTIFRIYSMTKPVTSIAVMMLYERGLLSLSDPLHRFVPAFREVGVFTSGRYPNFQTQAPERPITVFDLLTHTSGLTYGFLPRTNVDAGYRRACIDSGKQPFEGSLLEWAERLATLPLEFSPGARWNYSVSTDVCGAIVEVVSGKPFDAFVRDEILEPLSMHDTGFFVPDDKLARFAACYEYVAADGSMRLQDDPQRSSYLEPPRQPWGGSGLVSTVHDYLRFCRMLLGGGAFGDVRLVSRKTLTLMTGNHLPGGSDLAGIAIGRYSESQYEGIGFGLGFSVVVDPVRARLPSSTGEYGWGGAASTAFWVDPREDLAVIFLTQLIPSSTYNLRGELRQMVYGAFAD